MKPFYKVSLLPVLFLCSFQSLNAQITSGLSGFGDVTAFPDPLIAGKSGGMGLLEFTIKDELRDPYINPAKFYKNSGTLAKLPSTFNLTRIIHQEIWLWSRRR